MPNLNKPAKELIVDCINQTSRKVNPNWVDIPYAAVTIGAPSEVSREAATEYKNSHIDVYDATDVLLQRPYSLFYDRVDMLDVSRKYANSFILHIPSNTESITTTELIPTLNAVANLKIVPSDLILQTATIQQFPMTMSFTAHPDSMIYHGTGSVIISTPLQSVLSPVYGEMSALGVSLFGQLSQVDGLNPGAGFIQSFGAPPNSKVTQYVEHYSGPGGTSADRVRYYTRSATLSQAIAVERLTVLHLNANSLSNFKGLPEDFIGRVVQIGDELCKITDLSYGAGGATQIESLTVLRGLDDTIPVPHGVGSVINVIRDDSPDPLTATSNGSTINVKLLGKVGDEVEPLGAVNYTAMVFNNRLRRPYPPRHVRVNGKWDSTIRGANRTFEVRWEHHRRRHPVSNTVMVDQLSWYDHAYQPTADADVEYQVTVTIASSGAMLYQSTRTTGNALTFEMPEFTGQVKLRVTSMIQNLTCWQSPEIEFSSQVGNEFGPQFGPTVTLVTNDDTATLDAELFTAGLPASVGFSSGGNAYPYTVDWQVKAAEDPDYTTIATNTPSVSFETLAVHAGKQLRAAITMSNAIDTVSRYSNNVEIPAQD